VKPTEFTRMRLSVEHGVAAITFNRPESRNAWAGSTAAEYRWALHWCHTRSDVRVVVVSGENDFCVGADSGLLDEIGLVERNQPGLVAGAQLVEHGLDGRAVLAQVRIGRVDDLDQDVGPVDLLEGRAERVDQLVRELVDEPDRIGDDRGLAVAELDLAARRIERREELVLGEHVGVRERVEERTFPRVRVADDGDDGNVEPRPSAPSPCTGPGPSPAAELRPNSPVPPWPVSCSSVYSGLPSHSQRTATAPSL